MRPSEEDETERWMIGVYTARREAIESATSACPPEYRPSIA